ncbi:cytochrome P450 [Apiospora arundinis]
MANFNQTGKGFLVPEWFEEQPVIASTMNTASVFLGLSLGSAVFAGSKAMQQTSRMWKRHRTITTYAIMIWLHWIASIALGIINWFYMWGTVEPSFWLFFGILIVWVAQTQLLVQIIINRLSLLMMIRWNATKLKWGVAALMTAINVSVFIVWIPARLQISEAFVNCKCHPS